MWWISAYYSRTGQYFIVWKIIKYCNLEEKTLSGWSWAGTTSRWAWPRRLRSCWACVHVGVGPSSHTRMRGRSERCGRKQRVRAESRRAAAERDNVGGKQTPLRLIRWGTPLCSTIFRTAVEPNNSQRSLTCPTKSRSSSPDQWIQLFWAVSFPFYPY